MYTINFKPLAVGFYMIFTLLVSVSLDSRGGGHSRECGERSNIQERQSSADAVQREECKKRNILVPVIELTYQRRLLVFFHTPLVINKTWIGKSYVKAFVINKLK